MLLDTVTTFVNEVIIASAFNDVIEADTIDSPCKCSAIYTDNEYQI